MFRVKICGITTPEDALAAATAGADAVGLNFFPGSSRFIHRATAQKIVDVLKSQFGESVTPIGVFVNASIEEVAETIQILSLRWIQLHGNENVDYIAQLQKQFGGKLRILRAFRPRSWEDLKEIAHFARECKAYNIPLQAVLIDAATGSAFGGTGQLAAWDLAGRYREAFEGQSPPPLVLAGGLTPENLAEAIRSVRPDGVDTASGVEIAPGRKDPVKIKAFVQAAHQAFEALSRFRLLSDGSTLGKS